MDHPHSRRSRPEKRHGSMLLPLALVLYLLGCGTGLMLCRFGHTDPALVRGTPSEPVETTQATQPTDGLWRPEAGEEWCVMLVNAEHPLDGDVDIEITQLINGHEVDSRCYPALQEMMDACRADGHQPLICSSYRTYADQEELYQNKVADYRASGYSQEEAEEKAAHVVAIPGTSEHHLGLAVDIVDIEYQLLNEEQERTGVQKWLLEHCWEYGFVLRYPNDKSQITGIIYEPWHYRYVGKEAAQAMYETGLCLEEYLQQING